jgi:transcriptional regulator with XRE-family HTH domain
MVSTEPPWRALGRRLATARTAHRWSIAQLTVRLDVQHRTLTRWEAGQHRPSRHMLRRLATLLDLPYTELAALAGYPVDDAGWPTAEAVMVDPPRASDPWQALGARIRAERLARGMTRAELAAQLGVTQTTVGRWEQGDRRPRWSVLVRLAEVLAIPHPELDALTGYAGDGSWRGSRKARVIDHGWGCTTAVVRSWNPCPRPSAGAGSTFLERTTAGGRDGGTA